MVNGIANVIKAIINPVIIAGFVVVLIALIKISADFKKLGAEMSEQLNGTRARAVINPKTLALKQREIAMSKREDVYGFREKFNGICAGYSTWTQTIPIFPLLGILGTVAGLILQVSTQSANEIYASLNLALSSTLYGLIAAIVLKVVEACALTSRINKIESTFDEYDEKYSDAITMREFIEEQDEK